MVPTKHITARKTFDGIAMTTWLVQWPSTMTKQGKAYYATTYPNSDLIYMETAASRRPISALQGRKLLPKIRSAIETAKKGIEL